MTADVLIDYYSEFIEVKELKEDTKSETVIKRFTKIFVIHGIRDNLVSMVKRPNQKICATDSKSIIILQNITMIEALDHSCPPDRGYHPCVVKR